MPMNAGLHLCLVAVVVAMTTAAPVSNEERLIDVTQAANNLNRDKRADEMVYFGNQQNNAQSMAKKSDPSRYMSQIGPDLATEQGEEDEGAHVTAHDATPVEADLNARAESMVNEDTQDLRDAEAVESAMHSAFGSDASDSDVNVDEAISDNVESQDESVEDTPEEAKEVEEEEGGEEEKESEKGEEEEGSVNNDSSEEDDLNLAAALDEAGNSESTEVEADNSDQNNEDEGDDGTTESTLPDGDDDKEDTAETGNNVGHFLQSLGDNKNGNSDSDYDQQELQLLRYYYNNFVYPKGSDNNDMFPYPDHYRRRRSSKSKRFGSPIVARRARRIKRDLYEDENDDGYYGVLPWTSEEAKDTYLSGLGDYSSTNTDLSNYFYNRLYNYLSDPYINDNDDKYYVDRDDDVNADVDPEDWVAEQEYLQKAAAAPTYWRYEPEEVSEPVEEMSFPDEGLERMDYDRTERRKRYFFPFGEEPETHWGAFVPEKRSYADALERLQRLALALSDDPRPYQQQALEQDYRK